MLHRLANRDGTGGRRLMTSARTIRAPHKSMRGGKRTPVHPLIIDETKTANKKEE